MSKLVELDGKEYDNYVRKHAKSHFLQSYAWGQFCKVGKNLTPYYLGLIDNKNNILAAALLLQKKIPLGLSYFYSPRGFVIDFTDSELLKDFSLKVVEFVKNKKGIFLKIDPDLVLNEEDCRGQKINPNYDTKQIFSTLEKIGFRHQGFTKNFETSQPRYTFRINLDKPMEDIENNFSKTVKQRIKKGTSLGTDVRIGTVEDIEEFSKLMMMTEDRKGFVSHNKKYYQDLYEIYNKQDKMNLFVGTINTTKVIDMYEKEKEEININLNKLNEKDKLSTVNQKKKKELEMRIDKLNEYISEYSAAREKYGEEIVLNSHVIIEYGDKAWTLYAGNHNVLSSSQSNYKVYYEHIKYCHDKGIKCYDHFGTIGDLNPKNSRYGLHVFKKSFGGNYIEFIGEFDYITKPFMYFVFKKLVPLYRKTVMKIAKKKLSNSLDNQDI